MPNLRHWFAPELAAGKRKDVQKLLVDLCRDRGPNPQTVLDILRSSADTAKECGKEKSECATITTATTTTTLASITGLRLPASTVVVAVTPSAAAAAARCKEIGQTQQDNRASSSSKQESPSQELFEVDG